MSVVALCGQQQPSNRSYFFLIQLELNNNIVTNQFAGQSGWLKKNNGSPHTPTLTILILICPLWVVVGCGVG